MTAKGDCYAGIFCSGKQFCGVGVCPQGIFVEVNGERQIAVKGSFAQLYLRVRNDCQANSHQFFYSLDGVSFIPVGDVFSMRSGYWKGIRVGLFCYGKDGKAQFDKFEQVIKK